jgi:transcriptional regulator with GAF, ATPase, and Fis domain
MKGAVLAISAMLCKCRAAPELAATAETAEPDLFKALARIVGQKDGGQLSIDAVEQTLMNLAVERSQGKLAGAARMLGLTRPQMAYRMRKMGLKGK